MKKYTVNQIVRYIKAVLEEDAVLGDVFLDGEISGLKSHSSGHMYFTIKDDEASLPCVMFKPSAQNLSFAPRDGMRVVAWGRVSVYERSGLCQLLVGTLSPQGVGELHIATEQLRRRMEDKGMFLAGRKRSIPKYPKTIGIATSADGAALADITKIMERLAPWCRLVLAPARVQGSGADVSIASAVRELNDVKEVDVIIVGRGGGSYEDLAAFNSEVVAEAVYASLIPTVSAVGHETDTTICDLVADLRAPTPSAAAQAVAASYATLPGELSYVIDTMSHAMYSKASLVNGGLGELLSRMSKTQDMRLQTAKSAAGHGVSMMESLSPMSTLSRGFAIVSKRDARISSVANLSEGDSLTVMLSDGSFNCEITSLKLD